MTREELRTLAVLDVFGLLDEYETNLYTRSFHHASAAVQDEILELQASIASNPPLVPADEPSDELRSQVMRTVMEAMDTESRKFAPIASIGRGRSHASADLSSRRASIRGAQYWRAAAFVLAGGLVVMAYFLKVTVDRADEVTKAAIQILTAEQASQRIGHDFEYFVSNPDCEQITLVPTEDGLGATGIVYVNRATEEAFLFSVGLPHDTEQYVLRCTMNDGSKNELDSFAPRASLFGLRLGRISGSVLAAAVRWEIATLDGTVLLRSA